MSVTTRVIAGLTAALLTAGVSCDEHGASSPGESDPSAVAAQQVRACERQHGLERAHDVAELELTSEDEQFGAYGKTSISFCEWPPPAHADQDGFSQIIVTSQQGPAQDEASGANALDRYQSDCRKIRLAYSTGTQGTFSHLDPITVRQGAIVDAWEGEPWPPPSSELSAGSIYPYPQRNEVVVVRNSKVGADFEEVRCVA